MLIWLCCAGDMLMLAVVAGKLNFLCRCVAGCSVGELYDARHSNLHLAGWRSGVRLCGQYESGRSMTISRLRSLS